VLEDAASIQLAAELIGLNDDFSSHFVDDPACGGSALSIVCIVWTSHCT
jgi:hypothetical protein